jgi:hypothetical protein
MILAGPVARKKEVINAYRILVFQPEGKVSLWRKYKKSFRM